MKRLMFLMLAMIFVVCISISSAIGAGPYLKWDVGQDGTFDTGAALNPGETLVVDLWITDVGTDVGPANAPYFNIGNIDQTKPGLNYQDDITGKCLFVWNGSDKPAIEVDPYWDFMPFTDITQEGWIGAWAGNLPGDTNDHKLITIELEFANAGSETFDFTEPDEEFNVGNYLNNVDTTTYALTITTDGGGAPNLSYANSHNYTLSEPPRYCPPGPPHAPIGVHPEYALGSPDEKGTGWGPETGELILGFPSPLKNVEGDDLTIWHVGDGTPKIWVSTQSENPDDWHEIGSLPASQEWRKDTFEFGNLDIIHYVKVEEWQSGQHTCHFIDAVAGVPGTPAVPQVDIRINGQDGPVILHQSDTLSLAIAVDNKGITDDADWWLAVNIPSFGLYFFTPEGWTDAWLPVLQYPLFYIPLTDLFEFPVSVLPSGPYTFYFVVDTVMDGNLSVDNLSWDYIEVNIEP